MSERPMARLYFRHAGPETKVWAKVSSTGLGGSRNFAIPIALHKGGDLLYFGP
jgi:hypothetical protein